MKILFEGDSEIVITLACIAGGLCLLKKTTNPPRGMLHGYPQEVLEAVHINLYSDYQELGYFLGNLHMQAEIPNRIFVDLNIVKKKEAVHVIALLWNLKHCYNTEFVCVLNMHLTQLEMWKLYSRYFRELFIVQNHVLSQMEYDSDALLINHIGDLISNLSRLINY